jgi:hypothetical protein
VPFGYKDQFRAAGSKIKFEHPRRGKILTNFTVAIFNQIVKQRIVMRTHDNWNEIPWLEHDIRRAG